MKIFAYLLCIFLFYSNNIQANHVLKEIGLIQISWLKVSENKSTDANLLLGFDIPTQKYGFNGKMDDVKIYGKKLDAAEIKRLFNASKAQE